MELELLRDQDINLFIERGMRGGISMISKRYAKASKPLVEGHDTSKPKNYTTYLDANNLYRYAMRLTLPKSGFKWMRVMPTEEQIKIIEEHFKKGWILELDLEHDPQNSHPLVPEKKVTKSEQMSGYQRHLMADLNLDLPNGKTLVLILRVTLA